MSNTRAHPDTCTSDALSLSLKLVERSADGLAETADVARRAAALLAETVAERVRDNPRLLQPAKPAGP
jgi:hypothetical protein